MGHRGALEDPRWDPPGDTPGDTPRTPPRKPSRVLPAGQRGALGDPSRDVPQGVTPGCPSSLRDSPLILSLSQGFSSRFRKDWPLAHDRAQPGDPNRATVPYYQDRAQPVAQPGRTTNRARPGNPPRDPPGGPSQDESLNPPGCPWDPRKPSRIPCGDPRDVTQGVPRGVPRKGLATWGELRGSNQGTLGT